MSVARDCLGCSKPSGETSTIQTHVRRSGGRVAVEALLCRTSVRRTYVQEEAMSAIAVPPSPRPASRTQVRERTAEPVAEQTGVRRIGRAAGQVPPRPRLRLVTDDFVPEVPSCRAADVVARRPAAASALTMPAPPMRRPARPAALRGRRAELEKLAPQHPAVRASRLREGGQRGGAPQEEGREDFVVGPAREPQERAVRSGAGPRLLRGGSRAVIAAIVLTCCGLMLGGLVGLTSPTSSASAAQGAVRTTTTVVRPGESLWEIAAASGTSDVSAMVTRIVELNDLESATVHAGQPLEVPVG